MHRYYFHCLKTEKTVRVHQKNNYSLERDLEGEWVNVDTWRENIVVWKATRSYKVIRLNICLFHSRLNFSSVNKPFEMSGPPAGRDRTVKDLHVSSLWVVSSTRSSSAGEKKNNVWNWLQLALVAWAIEL